MVLAAGSTPGQYGLIVNPGGSFLVWGSTRTSVTTATGNVPMGSNSVTVNGDLGWAVGDTIAVDTEAVVIQSVSGNTVTFAPVTGQPHYSTMTVAVSNLTRNVVVMSSDTTNTGYIENLATSATNFVLTYGQFNYIGAGKLSRTSASPLPAREPPGSISSCTIQRGLCQY